MQLQGPVRFAAGTTSAATGPKHHEEVGPMLRDY
jgi:hypothetical protein